MCFEAFGFWFQSEESGFFGFTIPLALHIIIIFMFMVEGGELSFCDKDNIVLDFVDPARLKTNR